MSPNGPESPIDLALNIEELYPVAEFLLEQPMEIDQEYLTLILHSTISHYEQASEEEKEGIIGAFSQRLCGGYDVHEILNANKGAYNDKYVAHLHWYGDTNSNKEDLEGFQSELFLQVRVRNCIEHYAKEYIENDGIETEYLKILKAEISRDVQTYWIMHYAKKIQKEKSVSGNLKFDNTHQLRFIQALTKGVIESIKKLPENDAIIIETGWKGHAVYTRIKRILLNRYELTVHNLGELSHEHQKHNNPNMQDHIYPYPLGYLDEKAWGDNQEGHRYLLEVLKTTYQELPGIQTAPIIYDKTIKLFSFNFFKWIFPSWPRQKILIGENVTNIENFANLVSLRLQTVGNCVVANHDAAHRDLIPKAIFERLLLEESHIPTGRTQQGVFNKPYQTIALNLWRVELKKLFPGAMSINRLYSAYQSESKSNQGNELTWPQVHPYFVEPSVNHENRTYSLQTWLDHLLAQENASHTVHLLFGDSGSGKSSSLHWCTDYLWENRRTQHTQWIPIFISLSHIPSYHEKRNFVEHYFSNMPLKNSPLFLSELKEDYRFVFFLDGYDELKFRDDLRNLVEDGQLNKWQGITILSCRKHLASVCDSVFRGKIKSRSIIEEFDDTKILHYLDKKKINPIKVESLKNNSLWELMRNPLLLYMIIDVWSGIENLLDLQASITRTMIYERFTQKWFDREFVRLIEEHANLVPYLYINGDQNALSLLRCAQILALQMFAEGSTEVLNSKLDQNIRIFLDSVLRVPNPEPMIQVLRTTCPLKAVGNLSFQFIHQSFMEYLVASYLIDELLSVTRAGKENYSFSKFLHKKIGDNYVEKLISNKTQTMFFLFSLLSYKKVIFHELLEVFFPKISSVTDEGFHHFVGEKLEKFIKCLAEMNVDYLKKYDPNMIPKLFHLEVWFTICRFAYQDLAEWFIDNVLDFNINQSSRFGYIGLHFACESKKLDFVKFLVERGSNVMHNEGGATPLHHASRLGNPEIVEYLCDNGANVNSDSQNEEGHSPLIFAMMRRNIKIALKLIERGANLSYYNKMGENFYLLVKKENSYSEFGFTQNKVEEELKAIEAKFVELPSTDKLMIAACQGNADLIKEIVEENPEYVNLCIGDNNVSLLHQVCWRGHLEIVKYLVSKGAETRARIWNGRTPLHYAIQCKHLEIVKFLVSQCHDALYDKDDFGHDSLRLAEKFGNDELFNFIENEVKFRSTTNPLFENQISNENMSSICIQRFFRGYQARKQGDVQNMHATLKIKK